MGNKGRHPTSVYIHTLTLKCKLTNAHIQIANYCVLYAIQHKASTEASTTKALRTCCSFLVNKQCCQVGGKLFQPAAPGRPSQLSFSVGFWEVREGAVSILSLLSQRPRVKGQPPPHPNVRHGLEAFIHPPSFLQAPGTILEGTTLCYAFACKLKVVSEGPLALTACPSACFLEQTVENCILIAARG